MSPRPKYLRTSFPKAHSSQLPFPFFAALLQALTLALATSIPNVGVVSDGGIEDTTEAKAAATRSLPSRRLRFAHIKPGASALALGRTPSVYISVISSAALVAAGSPRGPVSTGTPLVDVGRALRSSVLDLVLVIGTFLALSVTDIFTVQQTSFSLCSWCSALVFQAPDQSNQDKSLHNENMCNKEGLQIDKGRSKYNAPMVYQQDR